jgi:hypothetical protein
MEHLHTKNTTGTFNSSKWQSPSQSSQSTSPTSSDGSSDYSYYAYLEENINNKAKKLTVDYLNSRGGNSTPLQEQTFLVYKFIHTPIDAIIAGM